MKKIILMMFVFLLYSNFAIGQVGAYSFSQTSGTYTEITGGVSLGTETIDDQVFLDPATPGGDSASTGVGHPIGFTFNYGGQNYDRFGVNANGWITLGLSTLTPAVNRIATDNYAPLGSLSAKSDVYVATIAAFANDLQAQTGATIIYQTTGTAPNRVFVIQWKNYKKYGDDGIGDIFNFQIRLTETTNTVRFVYGAITCNTTSDTFEVGMRGPTAILANNFVNRTSTTSWATTTAGSAAVNAVVMTDVIKPANGLTFTYTPAACIAPLGLVVSNITTATATLTWSALTPAPASYEYVIQTGTAVPTIAGTSVATNTANIIGLSSSTTYNVFLRSSCSTGFSNWALAGTFSTLCLSENLPIFQTVEGTTGTALPNCWTSQLISGTNNWIGYSPSGTFDEISVPLVGTRVFRKDYNSSSALLFSNALNYTTITAPTRVSMLLQRNTSADVSDEYKILINTSKSLTGAVQIANIPLLTTAAPVEASKGFYKYTATIPASFNGQANVYVIIQGITAGGFSSYSLGVDDVKVEIIPSCVPPTALVITNISSTGAQVAWTAPTVPAALGYDFIVTTTNVFPLASATPTGSSATAVNTATISGLTPNTLYYVWVRGKCSASDVGPWSDSTSFSTNCADVTAFTQNFDAGLTIPACWKKLGTGGTGTISATASTSTPNSLSMNSSGTTVATQGLIVMPPVSNAGAGTHRLRFRARSTSTVGGIIEVGYLSNNFDGATFNSVQSFTTTSTTSFDSFVAILGVNPGTNKFLAFRHSGSPTNAVLIDDVAWEVLPTCLEPTALIVTSITNNGGQVDWTEPTVPAALGYDYLVTTTNVTPMMTATPTGSVGSGNNSATFSSLTPNTVYYVWVRSKCTSTDRSGWSSSTTFLTNCANATTFSQNFDAGTTLPACWKKLGAGGSAFITTSGNTSTPNALSINSTGITVATQGLVVMPPVSNAGAGTYRLRFRARSGTVLGGIIQVGYLTDNFDANSFVTVQSFTTTSLTSFDSFSAILGSAPGSNLFLGFRNAGNPLAAVLIDDVSWELTPTCFEPTTVVASAINSSSANVSWTEPLVPAANGYEYFISTTNTAPAVASVATGSVGVGIGNFTFTSLPANTTQFVWVRSVCSASDKSGWSAFISFRTLCSASNVPFVENFETAIVPAVPSCSVIVNAGTGNNWLTTTTTGNGFSSKILRYPYNSNNAANAWFFTQGINLVAGTSYNISYKYGSDSTIWTEKLKVAYGLNPTVDGMTVQLADYPAINQAIAQNEIITFIPTASGVYYFGFNAYSVANQNGLLLDDINIVATPNCRVVTALGSNTITSSSAVLSWTAPTFNVPANGYQYIVTASPTVPTAASVATGNTAAGVTSFTVTTLPPDTLQYVWVRSACSATETSAWTGTVFRTLCSAVTTFSQNFDLATTFPTCFNKIGSVGTATILASNSASAPNCLTMNSPSATTRAVVSMPPVSNASAGTHWLKFKARSRFAVGGVIEVGYLTNFSDANSFVNVQSFTTTSTTVYANFNAFLGTAPGANQVLAFRHSGVPANEVLIDDVSWEAIPACAEPTGLTTSNVAAATATVSWTASSSLPANGYQYFVSTTNTPPTAASVATGSTAAGVVTVNLTGLNPTTQYFVWVRSICNATTSSAWSPAVTFTTPCAVVSTLNQNFATFPPLCFSTSSAGTVATGPTGAAGGLWVADGFLNVTSLGAARANMYQSNNNSWLITPTMNLTSGNYVFSFKYGLTAYNATTVGVMGSDDSVKVLISTNGTTWSELATFNAASNVTNLSNDYSYSVPAANATANVRFALLASDGTVVDTNDIEFFVDDLKVEVVLSNNTFDNTNFSYYPNPVKDILNLDYSQNITNVSVFNLLGQQVITKTVNANQSKIDMSNLNAGTYLVKVTADNQVKTIKVIKE